MYPKLILSQPWKRQQGSMLVIALFVIVVLAYLGLTVTKLLSASTDNVIYEVLGQRALNAARTGIECRIATSDPNTPLGNAYCTKPENHAFVNVAGLENCQYFTEVNNKTVVDGSKTLSYFQFSSTGQCEIGNIVVSRTVYMDAIM